eukprot:9495940-Pyramimonas_sp.AAC.2
MSPYCASWGDLGLARSPFGPSRRPPGPPWRALGRTTATTTVSCRGHSCPNCCAAALEEPLEEPRAATVAGA